MKDKISELMASREQLLQQMPDPSSILPGSLLRRMVRCDKAGCPCCENGKGKGHGPIWILSVRLGGGRLRQILIPAELKPEVEEALQTFVQMKEVLNIKARPVLFQVRPHAGSFCFRRQLLCRGPPGKILLSLARQQVGLFGMLLRSRKSRKRLGNPRNQQVRIREPDAAP